MRICLPLSITLPPNQHSMTAYVINVADIEEYQTIRNMDELDKIFTRAKSTIVNGEPVLLVRRQGQGKAEKFDQLTTLEDLAAYRKRVYQYL